MKKIFVLIAITAFLCHVLLTGAAASGQDDSALTVNPSAEPLAQEEMHRMVEEAAEDEQAEQQKDEEYQRGG